MCQLDRALQHIQISCKHKREILFWGSRYCRDVNWDNVSSRSVLRWTLIWGQLLTHHNRSVPSCTSPKIQWFCKVQFPPLLLNNSKLNLYWFWWSFSIMKGTLFFHATEVELIFAEKIDEWIHVSLELRGCSFCPWKEVQGLAFVETTRKRFILELIGILMIRNQKILVSGEPGHPSCNSVKVSNK